MLNIDTLNALHDLMATTLYNAEVAHLPKLTRAEEEELVKLARGGDVKARAALVVSCLHYALGKAHHYYRTRQPHHDDLLDLAQVASLEMVIDLDVALTKRSPAPYLRGIAARAISIYLTYHSPLIRRPPFSLEKLAATEIPTVERLDVPAYRESTRLTVDIIELAPPPDETPTESADQRFAPLYEALARLTPSERNRVIKRFGLGRPDLMDAAVSATAGVATKTVQKLREALAGHLQQMLYPEQEE